jgi:photosystem II stability/assembly factor-like uncharacterized protein
MIKTFCTILLLAIATFFCEAQKINILEQGKKVSIRGLSVVNDRTFWVSGNNGTVALSVDGGKTIKWMKVPGYDSIDFRDIEAFSSTEAVIMGISEPAYILKTLDAGATWKLVYENKTKGIFLDAMEWWNQQSGIVIGDPLDGKPFFIRSFDEGNTWQQLGEGSKLPSLEAGEACFASSGTNIRAFGKKEAVFITGGLNSRFFKGGKTIEIPIVQGKETTGANSVAVSKNKKNIIIVGGDFNNKNDTLLNCAISKNSGKSFVQSTIKPNGYRSCVEFISNKKAITCGLNGTDISNDAGKTWTNISTESFNVCRKAKDGKVVYFAGGNGKIGVLVN